MILRPAYVAGKVGEVCGKEILSSGEPSDRWLIQVDSENMLVSLYLREFQVLNQND